MSLLGHPRHVFICQPRGIMVYQKKREATQHLRKIGACNPSGSKAAQPTLKQYLIHRVFQDALGNPIGSRKPKGQSASLKARHSGSWMRWPAARPVIFTATQNCIITAHHAALEKTRRFSTSSDKHDTGKIPFVFIFLEFIDYIKKSHSHREHLPPLRGTQIPQLVNATKDTSGRSPSNKKGMSTYLTAEVLE